MSVRFGAPDADFVGFSNHLHAIFGAGIPAPSQSEEEDHDDVFTEALRNCLDVTDLQYLRWIVAGGEVPQWYCVDYLDARFENDDPVEVASSLEIALASVIRHALYRRIRIAAIRHEGSAYHLDGKHGLIARLKLVEFENPPPPIVQRVRSAFSGVTTFEHERLASRLRAIPGLGMLLDVRWTNADQAKYGGDFGQWAADSTVRNLAQSLKRGLNRNLGIDAPLSKVQESMARAVGSANWATLIASETQARHINPPMAIYEDFSNRHERRHFYRTQVEAVAGLAQISSRLLTSKDRLQIFETSPICIFDSTLKGPGDTGSNLLCVWDPAEASVEEADLERARAVLRHRVPILDMFKPGRSGNSILQATDLARESQPIDVLYVTGKVFTKSGLGNYTYIQAEDVDGQWERTGRIERQIFLSSVGIALRGGALVLTKNEGNDEWINLSLFNGNEVTAILSFFGLQLPTELKPSPTKKPRRPRTQ